jgi:hypothetical protein
VFEDCTNIDYSNVWLQNIQESFDDGNTWFPGTRELSFDLFQRIVTFTTTSKGQFDIRQKNIYTFNEELGTIEWTVSEVYVNDNGLVSVCLGNTTYYSNVFFMDMETISSGWQPYQEILEHYVSDTPWLTESSFTTPQRFTYEIVNNLLKIKKESESTSDTYLLQ